jgi:hypothetical protein
MITFFFIPSTTAMGAAQISIPPGYPNGTTQSNQTNATASERRRLDLGSLELKEGVCEEGRGGYLARSGGWEQAHAWGMRGGGCAKDFHLCLIEQLGGEDGGAEIAARDTEIAPRGRASAEICRVEYPSGVVQGKGAGRAGSLGWKPARPGDQGAAAMDRSRQPWLEVLWTRFAADLADRRDSRPARGERQNRAPILSVDAYVRYISSSRDSLFQNSLYK